MDAESAPLDLSSILANLSRQIRQPLDLLQEGIGQFLDDPERPLSDAERAQGLTMLTLCDDLGRLTYDRLGGPPPLDGVSTPAMKPGR